MFSAIPLLQEERLLAEKWTKPRPARERLLRQVNVEHLHRRLRQVDALVDERALPRIAPRGDQT